MRHQVHQGEANIRKNTRTQKRKEKVIKSELSKLTRENKRKLERKLKSATRKVGSAKRKVERETRKVTNKKRNALKAFKAMFTKNSKTAKK
jgi:hypothetical protein